MTGVATIPSGNDYTLLFAEGSHRCIRRVSLGSIGSQPTSVYLGVCNDTIMGSLIGGWAQDARFTYVSDLHYDGERSTLYAALYSAIAIIDVEGETVSFLQLGYHGVRGVSSGEDYILAMIPNRNRIIKIRHGDSDNVREYFIEEAGMNKSMLEQPMTSVPLRDNLFLVADSRRVYVYDADSSKISHICEYSSTVDGKENCETLKQANSVVVIHDKIVIEGRRHKIISANFYGECSKYV
mgnify:CR=1 FL=1